MWVDRLSISISSWRQSLLDLRPPTALLLLLLLELDQLLLQRGLVVAAQVHGSGLGRVIFHAIEVQVAEGVLWGCAWVQTHTHTYIHTKKHTAEVA
jgi:hypothetical protein